MIKKYYLDKNNIPKLDRNVSCIGFFDGVHKGHQALINKTVTLAKQKGIIPCLITFDPDPFDVISNQKIKHINSLSKRIALFEKLGIKEVVIIKFNSDIQKIKYDSFTKKILNKLSIDTLVCGYDFHYGYKGLGSYDTLINDSNINFNIEVVDEVKYYKKKVSSTRIKEEIEKGNYRLVNKLLGYNYDSK